MVHFIPYNFTDLYSFLVHSIFQIFVVSYCILKYSSNFVSAAIFHYKYKVQCAAQSITLYQSNQYNRVYLRKRHFQSFALIIFLCYDPVQNFYFCGVSSKDSFRSLTALNIQRISIFSSVRFSVEYKCQFYQYRTLINIYSLITSSHAIVLGAVLTSIELGHSGTIAGLLLFYLLNMFLTDALQPGRRYILFT